MRSGVPLIGFLLLCTLPATVAWSAERCEMSIARLKYGGGGDWYANPSSLPNLVDRKSVV